MALVCRSPHAGQQIAKEGEDVMNTATKAISSADGARDVPPRSTSVSRSPAASNESTVERLKPLRAGTFRAPAQPPADSNRSTALPAGTPAPDFALKSTPDQTVRLSEFRGRPVVLAFYPADWSPVCGDQMALYNEMLSEFQGFGAELLGISVDGSWCHSAFSRDRK